MAAVVGYSQLGTRAKGKPSDAAAKGTVAATPLDSHRCLSRWVVGIVHVRLVCMVCILNTFYSFTDVYCGCGGLCCADAGDDCYDFVAVAAADDSCCRKRASLVLVNIVIIIG